MMYQMMIVDDEAIVVEGIRTTIPWENYDVCVAATAGSGKEALIKLDACRPDLIIADIRMPGMDGLDFIKAVKERYPDTLFIVISAFRQFSYAQRAIELGVRCYLVKPIREDELIDRVRDCIQELKQTQARQNLPRQTPLPPDPGVQNHIIQKACHYIDRHVYEEISLVETARHVALTPSYLSAVFKQAMGLSFIEYVKKIRIEKAKELLRNTNKKSYEICSELGYKSVQYFSTLFRESVGMTPKEYRMTRRDGG